MNPNRFNSAQALRRKSPPKFEPLKEQPSSLSGGSLRDYQLEGLNWLVYRLAFFFIYFALIFPAYNLLLCFDSWFEDINGYAFQVLFGFVS